MSGDIELRNFVPLEQIPPLYFQRPYFLSPSGRSAKAYHLLARTMEKAGRVGVGSFVMRGHEYLVAIISDNGVLRADTLRYADEIRTPSALGLPKRGKAAAARVTAFSRAIDGLKRDKLDVAELEDREAEALIELAQSKQKDKDDVIRASNLEAEDPESSGAKVIDLMEVLRKSLSKNAVVTNAEGGSVISLAERRAARAQPASAAKKKTPARRKTKAGATRKRAKRA